MSNNPYYYLSLLKKRLRNDFATDIRGSTLWRIKHYPCGGYTIGNLNDDDRFLLKVRIALIKDWQDQHNALEATVIANLINLVDKYTTLAPAARMAKITDAQYHIDMSEAFASLGNGIPAHIDLEEIGSKWCKHWIDLIEIIKLTAIHEDEWFKCVPYEFRGKQPPIYKSGQIKKETGIKYSVVIGDPNDISTLRWMG